VARPHRSTSDTYRLRKAMGPTMEYGIVKAFILAAGRGSRMHPLAQDRPKSLLGIKDETILGRQLRILRSCGIAEITVVAGFEQEKIRDSFANDHRIVYNPAHELASRILPESVGRQGHPQTKRRASQA
jgi:mannose-1-phosphate guanylyltransferase